MRQGLVGGAFFRVSCRLKRRPWYVAGENRPRERTAHAGAREPAPLLEARSLDVWDADLGAGCRRLGPAVPIISLLDGLFFC